MEQMDWSTLSCEEKKEQLYLKQKDLLDMFLGRNAITKSDYEKSLGDLTRKMGMEQLLQTSFVFTLDIYDFTAGDPAAFPVCRC